MSGVSGERLLCTGAGSKRDAVVLFGNLPGARRHTRTEFHPVASGLGEGTQNHVAKRDAGSRCWWLVLAEQVGISVHIYWLGRVSWGDPTGTQRGVLGVAGAPSLLEMRPHVSISSIPPRGEERTQTNQLLLFLCVGSAKQSLLYHPCFRSHGLLATSAQM